MIPVAQVTVWGSTASVPNMHRDASGPWDNLDDAIWTHDNQLPVSGGCQLLGVRDSSLQWLAVLNSKSITVGQAQQLTCLRNPSSSFPSSSHSCSGCRSTSTRVPGLVAALADTLAHSKMKITPISVPILILSKLTPFGGGCKGTYSRMARNSRMAKDEHSLQHLCSSTTKR